VILAFICWRQFTVGLDLPFLWFHWHIKWRDVRWPEHRAHAN